MLKVAYGECTVSQKVFTSGTSSSQKVEKRGDNIEIRE